MAGQEVTVITSSHMHTEEAISSNTTDSENDL